MNRFVLRQSALLLICATVWGTAFVWQSEAVDFVGPFTFGSVRMCIGALTLLPVILLRDRFGHGETATKAEKKTLLISGLSCGTVLFMASALQQSGIKTASAGKAGFVTALYIVLVPVASLLIKKKPPKHIWLAVAIAVGGLYFLCVTGTQGGINAGDLMLLGCAVMFTLHIMLIDYFAPKVNGLKLSCLQFIVCAALNALFLALFERPDVPSLLEAARPIILTGVFSCGVAYTLQTIGQKGMNPTVASLIMSLESLVSVIAGWLLLGQELTAREIAGCVLMAAAIVLAQIPSKHSNVKQTV